jgi:uncharacterized protein YcfJ
VGRSKYPESPEFPSVGLRLGAEITNHRGNSTVPKPCRKHCLTCFMRSTDAFGRLVESLVGNLAGRLVGNLVGNSVGRLVERLVGRVGEASR